MSECAPRGWPPLLPRSRQRPSSRAAALRLSLVLAESSTFVPQLPLSAEGPPQKTRGTDLQGLLSAARCLAGAEPTPAARAETHSLPEGSGSSSAEPEEPLVSPGHFLESRASHTEAFVGLGLRGGWGNGAGSSYLCFIPTQTQVERPHYVKDERLGMAGPASGGSAGNCLGSDHPGSTLRR